MKFRNGFLCAAALALGLGCGASAAAVDEADEVTIGVITYNPDDGQTMAFRKYLEEYIGEAFTAEFYYSEACTNAEEEAEFITELHDLGVKGVIGTLNNQSTIDLCEEYGMYYVYGSASVSDELFEEIGDNEHFLGTISSSLEEEEASGEAMAAFFAEQDTEQTNHYLILSGGASQGSEMHRLRTVGMLNGLADAYGFTYEESVEDMALTEETIEVSTGTDVEITILPGYPMNTPLEENTQQLSEEKSVTTILSTLSADYVIDGIRAAEDTTGIDIKVGTVDCFTDNTYDLFNGTYSGGEQELDYLVGRYGAGIAPAYVAMCNAYAGYAEDFREDGKAFRLNQSFWTADSVDSFNELYGLSVGLFENTYSATDIMTVLKDFNPDATFEDFKVFTEGTSSAEATGSETEETGEEESDAASDSADSAAIASEAQEASEAAETEDLTTGLTIGVLTYNPEDAQNVAFKKYLQEYVGSTFNANFYYSDACNTEEEEHAFIEDLHARGVRGMIGQPQFTSTIELCEEYGIYYVFAASSASDELFEQLKDSEYFLGSISSSTEDEEAIGKDMAVTIAADETAPQNFLILSGGASMENEMHRLRTIGMLEGLAEAYGFTYAESVEELALTEETMDVEISGDVTVTVTIIPGYPGVTPLEENVQTAATEKDTDAVLSVVSADYVIDGIRAVEDTAGKDIKVGAVDCFTENAYDLFNGSYSGGEQELDYLAGTYGAGIAPAFVALANAMTGHAEDFRDNGEPFQLVQDFWTASDLDTFNELYGLSVGVAENIYSADGMMKALKDYNPDAAFEDYKTFVESANAS